MNLLLLTLLVSMQSTDLRMQADALFNDQQWAELIPVLDELIEDEPSAELYYDKGVALYEQASFELARNAFDEAMNLAADNELRAFSAYNYGNALFQETMQALEGTSEVSSKSIQAIEDAKSHIQQSLNHYRDAIQQDSSDIDARTNGEIAWHLLKQLEQMQEQMEKQQEEQQQEDANNQEQEEEQDSSGQEQEQQDDRDNEEQDEQQNQSNEDGQQQDSKSEESNQQSNDQNESSDEEGDPDEQKSEQQNANEGDAEQNEQDQSQQHKGDQQEQDQQLQDGKLETTDKQEEMQEGEEREGQVKREGNRLSKDETNRLLQLIRDKEKERRQAIAARKAKNRKPVTKDW